MGKACFYCPRCGFSECGENPRSDCPSCGFAPGSGSAPLKTETPKISLDCICRNCGATFDGSGGGCPRCDSDNINTLKSPQSSHTWKGNRLCCKNTQRSTVMPIDVACDIEYCPFCSQIITEHPMALLVDASTGLRGPAPAVAGSTVPPLQNISK